MKLKKLASLALAGALTLGLLPALSSSALAADGDNSTYTLTIPSTLSVAKSGWNATSGISATGMLASGKKLTVTASSGDEFALVNQSDSTQKVGYKLATASTDTEATTSWTFDSLSSTATKKDMGIIVEDYSSKPAGTYTDTVTFTAKVEDAAIVYPFGFSKQAWWGNPETGEIDVPANFVSVSQTDAKAAADAEKTSANAPGYVCIYALEGGQYKWIDSHGRTGQNSNLLDIANGDAWEEVYECHNAGDVNSIWFTVNK